MVLIPDPEQGIAPTLITLRVATGHSEVDEGLEEPVSNIVFKTQGSRRDAATVEETVTQNIGLSLDTASVPEVVLDEKRGDSVSV